MATVKTRTNKDGSVIYEIRVSLGRDIHGKQILKYQTWTPEPAMTAKQIEKALERRLPGDPPGCVLYLDLDDFQNEREPRPIPWPGPRIQNGNLYNPKTVLCIFARSNIPFAGNAASTGISRKCP